MRSPGGRSHLRPRVGQRAALGQVLWKAQVDAVVNRHHRAARRQRRQHVVRLVKDMWPACAASENGSAELLADRVRPRGVDRRAEVLAERGRELAVRFLADQDVVGLAVESRELAHDVADVRADAEVVQLAGIDRALSRSQPLHPQVSLQPRRPAGQVLAIIGQVALLPRAVRRSRRRRARTGRAGARFRRPVRRRSSGRFARIAAQKSTSSTYRK